jgi:hypothetical protein
MLIWENIESDMSCARHTQRAKVFGGWLVSSTHDVLRSLHADMAPQSGYEWREAICFVPDIKHEWVINTKQAEGE